MSDEQGERFHQDFKISKCKNKSFWDAGMFGDYCLSILRKTDQGNYKKRLKSLISNFTRRDRFFRIFFPWSTH